MKFRAENPDRSAVVVHHADERGVWATRGREVLHKPTLSADWKRIAVFPTATSTDYLVWTRLARRLFRAERCNVYPTRAGKLLGIRHGTTYQLPTSENEAAVPLFQIHGHCIFRRAIAEDRDGNLYFGEYFMNPSREPVRIWCLDAELEHFRIVHRFEHPRARHVHAVHNDPFRPERLWVTMGDLDGECFLAYTDDRFATLEFLGDGSQLWRMVGIIFQEERLCWLTDTHLEQNRIVSMERASGRIEVHGELDASVWYVVKTQEGIYLATTAVEPGPGIHTDRVRLLASEDGIDWQEVVSYRKDVFPMPAFGLASLSLPSGSYSAAGFWLSGEGIRGMDGRSRLCSLS